MINKPLFSFRGNLRWNRAAVLLFLVSLFLPGVIHAQNFKGLKIVPDEESRSVIRDADGYHPLGPNDSVEDARKKATELALADILKHAKSFIDSKTHSVKGRPKYELVKNKNKETMIILEKKDFGIKMPEKIYHVWIRSKVKYVLKSEKSETQVVAQADVAPEVAVAKKPPEKPEPTAKKAPAAVTRKSDLLTVRVWTDKKKYAEGEKVTIFLQGNQDYFARIVSTDSQKNVVQLLPNQYREMRFFKEGKIYEIPDNSQGDRFEIQSASPFGTDTITVYASGSPLGNPDLIPIGRGLNQVQGSRKNYARTLSRGLKIVGKKTSAEFYESSWTFETTPKSH